MIIVGNDEIKKLTVTQFEMKDLLFLKIEVVYYQEVKFKPNSTLQKRLVK